MPVCRRKMKQTIVRTKRTRLTVKQTVCRHLLLLLLFARKKENGKLLRNEIVDCYYLRNAVGVILKKNFYSRVTNAD